MRVVAPDEREGRQVERHRARARALPEHDRQLAVLHRRIQGLLHRAGETVDLVDEEHGAGLERCQERGHVALALQRRARRLHERGVELAGGDLRQRCLAEPGRSGQQDVVERLAAPPRRLHEQGELALELLLADELLEALRPQRAVELLLARR